MTKFEKKDKVEVLNGKWAGCTGTVRKLIRDENRHVLYKVSVEGAKPKTNTYRSYDIEYA